MLRHDGLHRSGQLQHALGWFAATLEFAFDDVADHLALLLRQVFEVLGHIDREVLCLLDFRLHLAQGARQLGRDRCQVDLGQHGVGHIRCVAVSLCTCAKAEAAQLIAAENPALGFFADWLALAECDRRAGDVFVCAELYVLGQDQGADLDHLVSLEHRAHAVAVVEVAVTEWVHADLGPGWIIQCSVRAHLGGRIADGFPLAKHGGNRALGCALCDLGCSSLVHAKGHVGHCSNRLIADHGAGVVGCLHFTVGGLGRVHADHPGVVLLVRRDVQAQLGKVALGQGV